MGQREGTIFPFCREIYSYDDPPSGLTNKICLTFWHLSKEVRNVLTSPAWKDRIKSGEFPYFCMNNGLCRYFEDKNSLDQHYRKNPTHRNVSFSKCKEEATRRVQLRQGSYSKKISRNKQVSGTASNATSALSPTTTVAPSLATKNRSCSPQEPCGNCDLCRPALQQQQQHQSRPRPPSPKEPHPDEIYSIPFQPSPSPSPSPPPNARLRESTPLRQTTKKVTPSISREVTTQPMELNQLGKTRPPSVGSQSVIPTLVTNKQDLVQVQSAKKIKLDPVKPIQSIKSQVANFRPPRTESSTILARLNLTMPKPEFLRSNSVQDTITSSSTASLSSVNSRDPRKRKIGRTTSMISSSSAITTSADILHSETPMLSPIRPKTQRLVPNSSNNNAGSKISLNHYIKYLHSKSTDDDDEVFTKSSDAEVILPHLPAPDELFEGVENKNDTNLLEDQPDPQDTSEMTTDNNNVKGKEEADKDALEQYFSKKSSRVSSWTRLSSSSQVSKDKIEDNDKTKLKENSILNPKEAINGNTSDNEIETIKPDFQSNELEDKSKEDIHGTASNNECEKADCEMISDLQSIELEKTKNLTDHEQETSSTDEILDDKETNAIEMDCVNDDHETPNIEEPSHDDGHGDGDGHSDGHGDGHVTIVFDDDAMSDHDIIKNHLGEIIATIANAEEVPHELVLINDNISDNQESTLGINEASNMFIGSTNEDLDMIEDPDLDDSNSARAILHLASLDEEKDEEPEKREENEGEKELNTQTNTTKITNVESNVFIDTNPDNPTSVAQVEVKSISPINENTVVLIYGVDKSVDFCPNCEKRLCPFKGAYTLNVVTYDVSVVCQGCSKTVVIKDLFTERQKALVWNDTKV